MESKKSYYVIIGLGIAFAASIIYIFVILLPQTSNLEDQLKYLEKENLDLQSNSSNNFSQNSGLLSKNSQSQLLFAITTTKHVKIEKTITSETHYVTFEDDFSLLPGHDELYKQISLFDNPEKVAIVDPVFTASAYSAKGFYDYYQGKCSSECLTVDINYNSNSFTSSKTALKIFQLLGYSMITDVDIDKNPQILNNYDKVILLHSEYVTRNEFNALTNFSNVIYLYPNALYAEVKPNYDKNTVTLVRGHSFPTKDISNGFGWKFDNSNLEYDTDCHQWSFSKIDNGYMLNCYPEFRVLVDKELLLTIKNLK